MSTGKGHGEREIYVSIILTRTTVVWDAGMFHMAPGQVDISGTTCKRIKNKWINKRIK